MQMRAEMMEKSFLPFECGRHIMDNLCSCEGAFQKESVIHKTRSRCIFRGILKISILDI